MDQLTIREEMAEIESDGEMENERPLPLLDSAASLLTKVSF